MITTSAETTMTLTVETGQDFLEMDKRLLSGTVTSLDFSPDGKWFASRRLPGDPEEGISGICIWKVDEQGVSQKSHSLTWECRRQMPVKVLFSSDSLGLVVFLAREPSRSSHEQLIAVSCILGARGYFEPVVGYYISNNKCVKRNAILKNGRRIILVWYDPKSKQRRMTIWDVNSEGDFEIFQEHEEPNDAFVWSEDGEQYLGVRADKTNGHHFSKSQTPGGMLLRQPLPTKYWLRSKAAFSPDGRWCAVDTLHSYQGLLVFEIMDGGGWELHASLGCRGTVSSIMFSPDSGTLVVSWWSNILCIWQLDSADKFKVISQDRHERAGCLAFLPDGRLLTVGGSSGISRIVQF
jgi:WD40 repeat protein